MIELKIPVANTRFTCIVGSPSHKVTLDDDKIEIVYDYEYQSYIDADNPELGVTDPIKKMHEEYLIERSAINLIALIRDEHEEVFTVALDLSGVMYDVSVSFKALKDAREFRSKLIDWRFNTAK